MSVKLKVKDGIVGVNGIDSLLLEDNEGRYYTYKDGGVELTDDIGSFITIPVDEEIVSRLLGGTTLKEIASALDASEEVEVSSKDDVLYDEETIKEKEIKEGVDKTTSIEKEIKEGVDKTTSLKGMTAFYLGE